MKMFAIWTAKAAILWLVLIVAGLASGMLFNWNSPPPPSQPLNLFAAILIVAALGAAVMALLAERSLLRGWKLGLVMAIILFSVEAGLSAIEAAAFNADLKIPPATLMYGPLSAALRDTAGGVAIALMWRSGTATPVTLRGLWWKAPVIAILYIAAYFAAGIFIAIRSEAVRAFYANIPQISGTFVLTLQFCRGLLWCGLAFLIVRNLRGPAWQTAVLTGVTFTVLMASQLLLPNPFMPWNVRMVHVAEIAASNSIFGVVAALILLAGARNRADNSAPLASPQPVSGA